MRNPIRYEFECKTLHTEVLHSSAYVRGRGGLCGANGPGAGNGLSRWDRLPGGDALRGGGRLPYRDGR